MQVGGLPEPFLSGSKAYYNRWKRSHVDLILREDLITLTAMRDIQAIETLIELLRSRIGSPVSAAALAQDLQRSPAKYYFYDIGMVQADQGPVLENLVACALLKEVHRLADVEGESLGLHYVRNKEGHEVDFLVTRRDQPHLMIEVTWRDANLSPSFHKLLPGGALRRIQVVGEIERNRSFPGGERIVSARHFLAEVRLL